jgi:hypothetical protein
MGDDLADVRLLEIGAHPGRARLQTAAEGNVGCVSTVLPHDEYVASLARKRMEVMVLFRDDSERVLLVNPTAAE